MTEAFNDIALLLERKTKIDVTLRETLSTCAASYNAETKTVCETLTHVGTGIEEFIASQKNEGAYLAKNINTYTSVIEKLNSSLQKVEELSSALLTKLNASYAAIEYTENAHEILSDIKNSFEKCFTEQTMEVHRQINLLQEKLNSIALHCKNLISLPRAYTDTISNYQSRMDLVFGIIGKQEIQKRKILGEQRTAYFLIDCSMSMRGKRIEKINTSVPAIITMLGENKAATHAAVLSFSKTSAWMHKDVQEIEEFKWKDCKVDSITNLGLAFGALSKMLNREMLETEWHRLPPIIVLICDWDATEDWEAPFNFLCEFMIFETAKKYAFVLDSADPIDAVLRFTGEAKNFLNVSADCLFTEMQKHILQREEAQESLGIV
jgi:uncharacterized protein YegL/CII-binding regulator of phage lambda lysogenization HflD